MPDEFPTLEAAALIGVMAAIARTLSLWAGLRASPKLVAALETALGAGDLRRAREVSDRSDAATAGRFGRALVEGLEGATGALGAERNVDRALSRSSAGVRRGLARDLAALAVLIGAGAYAERAELDAGRLFYGSLVAAVALTVVGAWLRQRTLHRLISSRASLRNAARRVLSERPAPSGAVSG
jgi:hypothetical protein